MFTSIFGVNKTPLVTLEFAELHPSFHHLPSLLLKVIRLTWPAVALLNIATDWMYIFSSILTCKKMLIPTTFIQFISENCHYYLLQRSKVQQCPVRLLDFAILFTFGILILRVNKRTLVVANWITCHKNDIFLQRNWNVTPILRLNVFLGILVGLKSLHWIRYKCNMRFTHWNVCMFKKVGWWMWPTFHAQVTWVKSLVWGQYSSIQ